MSHLEIESGMEFEMRAADMEQAFNKIPAAQNTGVLTPNLFQSEFAPGTVLCGSYRLVKPLARGGMGDIHLATHERLPGNVVVKVLSPELINDHDAFSRFRQEATVMAMIRHPNVVQLFDFNFTLGGLPYLVMEYLPGRNLGEILHENPFLSHTQVASIIQPIAFALSAAHSKGIVHRDLKPENVMIVPCEGQGFLVKVIDFGISKARRAANRLTEETILLGTPSFMSPEQAEGRLDEVDAPSDQFALAVISYLMLAGRTPWGAHTQMGILHHIVDEDPLPLTPDGRWRSVEFVLFRGMAKSPAKRYPSVLVFSQLLQEAMIRDGLLPDPFDIRAPFPSLPLVLSTPLPETQPTSITIEVPPSASHPIEILRGPRRAFAFLLALFLVASAGAGYSAGLANSTMQEHARNGWNFARGVATQVAEKSFAEASWLLGRFLACCA